MKMATKTYDQIYNELVLGYEWVNNGTVLVTFNWGLGKRCTLSIPADQWGEKTVRDLKAQVAQDIYQGRK